MRCVEVSAEDIIKMKSGLQEVEPAPQEYSDGLRFHFVGDGEILPASFYVKVYKDFKVDTNDPVALKQFLTDTLPDENKFRRKIYIDDCGWGSSDREYGVLIGVYDSSTMLYRTYLIPSFLFNGKLRDKKAYLSYSCRIADKIIRDFAPAEDTIFLICTGYVLKALRNALRKKGYPVKVARIGEPLQSRLQNSYDVLVEKAKERMLVQAGA